MRLDKRWVFLSLFVAVVATLHALGVSQHLSLDAFKRSQASLLVWRDASPLVAAGVYFAIYVATAALSLPGAAILTLGAGAIFGTLWGVAIASFASTLGATAAFLSARWLIRDWVQARFGNRLRALNAGIARDGGYYLFSLRLVPVVPFFAINLLMGLTTIRTWTFYWVSQLGMLAATIIYVNAGTQLSRIDSISAIASPGLLGSLALLGVFPLAARKLADSVKARAVYKRWPKPRRFDRNLVVIGGGSAGLVTAYIGSVMRAKVTLVEKHKLGGDCLNTGCVPSKALIRSAKFLSHAQRAQDFGARSASVNFDFAEVMERVQRVIQRIEPHDSPERYTNLGVDVVSGAARIVSPWEVEVSQPDGTTRRLTTRAIVIAAGARPTFPPLPGIEKIRVLTSDNVWSLRSLPRRLVVLGGGPIGCELTQAFARLGSQVTQVEMATRLLMREDPDVSQLIAQRFGLEGIDVRLEHGAKRIEVNGASKRLVVEHHGIESSIEFDELLVAVGRTPNLSGYGLEELGVSLGRTVEVNGYLQTNYPNIYAAGDVAGPYQFTHTAAHQAWYAAVNALLDPFKKFRADYRVIPWATFTEPEVARVGLNETEATGRNIPYEVTVYGIEDLDRAIADSEAHGFVKVLTVPGRDKILGATIVGEHAADLLAEYVLAMRHGIGLNKILRTIHTYPTLSEANKYAAGAWKRTHIPHRLLDWLERFHSWRLGSQS